MTLGLDTPTAGTVTIDIDHCKGCDLCIPACPPGVLAMSVEVNHMGYRYPELYAVTDAGVDSSVSGSSDAVTTI